MGIMPSYRRKSSAASKAGASASASSPKYQIASTSTATSTAPSLLPPPSASSSSSSLSLSLSPSPAPPSTTTTSQRKLAALSTSPALPIPRPLPTHRTRPIPNSYWATPLLLACEYPWTPKDPTRPKLDALLLAGVRTFIDLTERGELLPYSALLTSRCLLLSIDPASIAYHRFPIRDRCLPESPAQMYAIMDVLRDNARAGRVCAVHCRGGIGRTGMVIGCWLVESGVARDGREALGIIAREWKGVEKCKRYPNSPETGPQFEFVAAFHPSPKYRVMELELAA